MPKATILQKSCRSCGSKKILDILNLGNLYLPNFVSDNSRPEKFPLQLMLCRGCYLLQLKHNTPPSFLYTENYGYRSGINQTMRDELKGIVDSSLAKFPNKKKLTVLDIGANDGTLLSYYPKNFFRMAIDPVKKFARESKKYSNVVISDFFNAQSAKKALGNKKANIVTAISCFYDMEDPNKFVSDVGKILAQDGIFVIQQNYLVKMLTQNAFDNIVHEHLEYYSLTSLNNLLNKYGLEVFDLQLRELNGGSFRTYIGFTNKHPIPTTVYEQLELEKMIRLDRKNIYTDFAKRIKKLKKETYDFIKRENRRGKRIYVYGASTRGNTLLQYFKLNSKLIQKAVERNPEKWGMKIASVGIQIISEAQARREKPDYMLVLPWFFKTEFLEREKAYLKNGGRFIFPLPKLEIIGATGVESLKHS